MMRLCHNPVPLGPTSNTYCMQEKDHKGDCDTKEQALARINAQYGGAPDAKNQG